jgi:hypothetical protein
MPVRTALRQIHHAGRLEDPDGTPQCSAFRYQSLIGEFEAGLKLGIVSRLIKRWITAPPVSGWTRGVTSKRPKWQPACFSGAAAIFLKNRGPIYAALADIELIAGATLWRLRVMLTGKEDPTSPHFLRASIRHASL